MMFLIVTKNRVFFGTLMINKNREFVKINLTVR